jgi:hypothetical protein
LVLYDDDDVPAGRSFGRCAVTVLTTDVAGQTYARTWNADIRFGSAQEEIFPPSINICCF